jgi:Nucleotide modification associated domain 1
MWGWEPVYGNVYLTGRGEWLSFSGMEKVSTESGFDRVVGEGRTIFIEKLNDYGASWLAFRLSSLTDQMLIKVKRIRRLEELGGQGKVDEGIEPEYVGIINYALMALMRISGKLTELDPEGAVDAGLLTRLYDGEVAEVRELMLAKNHDYGEAWREMRVSSITDQIFVKLLRLKQMEDNGGPKISEPPPSHYRDIINYCIFALIRMEDQ